MKRYIALVLLGLASCNNPQPVKSAPGSNTFDLPAYFASQVKILESKKPVIQKTVWINGKQETKSIRVLNWKKELSIFTDADIDKRAWEGEFEKSVNDTSEKYTTANEKIPVKTVLISRKNGLITGIRIFIKNGNYLYTSTDTLSYYPDNYYQIKKMQQIRFMNSKTYKILGKF